MSMWASHRKYIVSAQGDTQLEDFLTGGIRSKLAIFASLRGGEPMFKVITITLLRG